MTFGLVSVPVRLYPAARAEHVHFNQLHEPCGSRVKQNLFCPVCERTVERRELLRGAEVDDGRYVVIDDADLSAASPKPEKAMEILEFVKLEQVDPVFFDASYYLVPDGSSGERPYYLLLRSLQELGHAAIARLVRQHREYHVIVRPSQNGLMMHTLYYADEIRRVAEYGHPESVTVADKELELAKMFVQSLATEFEPGKDVDRYRESLQQVIRAKAMGLEPTALAANPLPPAQDLMAALKASIEKVKAAQLPERRPVEAELSPAVLEAPLQSQTG